jgi:hypothetical protein
MVNSDSDHPLETQSHFVQTYVKLQQAGNQEYAVTVLVTLETI